MKLISLDRSRNRGFSSTDFIEILSEHYEGSSLMRSDIKEEYACFTAWQKHHCNTSKRKIETPKTQVLSTLRKRSIFLPDQLPVEFFLSSG